MPRCFLAKKSANNNVPVHRGPTALSEDTTVTTEDPEDLVQLHRIGSISAAKAVLSIQEPICPPPAHQASILASASSAVKAALNLKEQNNNDRGTQTVPCWPEAGQRPATVPLIKTARPPRRKKPAQRLPLNLTLSEPEDYSVKGRNNSVYLTTLLFMLLWQR